MATRDIAWIDRALAGLCAIVLLADCLALGTLQDHPAPALALVVATCLPLTWRSSHPLASLVVVFAGLIACAIALDTGEASIAVALLPLYTVSELGGRRRSVVVAIAATLVLVATTLQVDGHLDLGAGAVRLLLLIGAVALGDLVRTRRSLREEARGRVAREQRERESDHLRRLADERLRIARDVHDSIAHALVAINVRAGVAAHLGVVGDAQAALVEIKDVSSEALGDLRATLGLLRNEHDAAPTVPAMGLEGLPQLLERTRNAGLAASGELSYLSVGIPSPVGQAGFRIVQESLTNVLRHADATSASVRVRVCDGALEIDVEDDGTGAPGPLSGHGLRGMIERADALGGQLVAGPRAEGGWRVHALLPLAVKP